MSVSFFLANIQHNNNNSTQFFPLKNKIYIDILEGIKEKLEENHFKRNRMNKNNFFNKPKESCLWFVVLFVRTKTKKKKTLAGIGL